MAKATIEVEIPDGYEFDRFDFVNSGELYINSSLDRVLQRGSIVSSTRYIIVRKVEPVTELAVRFRPGFVAMDEDERWYWFPVKPNQTSFGWHGVGQVEFWCVMMPDCTDWKQSLMRVG